MANKPNNPSLWSKAKSLAKQKFDVYPSAYANGWAAKWYKSKGGTWSKAAEYGMEVGDYGGLEKYQEAGTTKKRMYDNAMEEYKFFMENPDMWKEDPEMHTPDGNFNLCLDCIKVDWSNPDDIMDAHRLIEEGYSIGTHYNEEAFLNGLKALNLPPPVYNSKPKANMSSSIKAMGGVHYGAYAPPVFGMGGMPCYECGGMYAEGGESPCPPGMVPDGKGNCVTDLSTPPVPESSYFTQYQNYLLQPGVGESIARRMIKQKRECKPGDECWTEITPPQPIPVPTPVPMPEPSPFDGMERLYMELTDADYAKVPENLRAGTRGNVGIRNRVPYGWKKTNEDGTTTVYYERGVPGTPGYQGPFSGKVDTSKYHFVDELTTPTVVKKDGGIHLDPAKKGTFKAQATRMNMSVQEAASHILANKEEYSPTMVKKANFAKNFAKEQGGYIFADGGEADGVMALTQINAMMDRLSNLRKFISQDTDLDPWISDKLSVMNHSATAINDYMQYGEEGQPEEMMEMAQGGGIPERYKNMGFTKVGVKKESTRPGKKWMVLAKKGDQYKVVHGGYDGMKDYTQHGSEKRRDRFWDRMGGKDSAKANDPFSPLYWHKRFGTWEEGGELSMYDDGGPFDSVAKVGDTTLDVTRSKQLSNLENNKWNRGLMTANSLVDPLSPIHYLPNKGFGSGLKAIAGLAAGLSGPILGYEKLFAKDKTDSYLFSNNDNKPTVRTREDVMRDNQQKIDAARMEVQKSGCPGGNCFPSENTVGVGVFGLTPQFFQQIGNMPVKSNMTATGGSGMGAIETMEQKRNGGLMKFVIGGNPIEQMLRQQSGQTGVGVQDEAEEGSYAAFNKQGTGTNQAQWQQTYQNKSYGDSAGFVAANNALIGLGMLNQVLGEKQNAKDYNKNMVRLGNTDAMYNAVNPSNPYGNYTTNVGIGPNFALVRQTPVQDFADANMARIGGIKKYRQGGSYMVTDRELMEILANGGDVEFL
jgi:hypothetical protein